MLENLDMFNILAQNIDQNIDRGYLCFGAKIEKNRFTRYSPVLLYKNWVQGRIHVHVSDALS